MVPTTSKRLKTVESEHQKSYHQQNGNDPLVGALKWQHGHNLFLYNYYQLKILIKQ